MPTPPRRTRPFAALLLVLALAPTAAAQAGPELFREGVDRYRAGDYAGAQRALRGYVEAYGERPGSEAAHLGEAYHYLGLMTPDARLAEGYFLAVTQRYPSSPVADESVARLAQLYAVRGEQEEARKQWQALARSYPLSRWVPEVDLRVGESWFAQDDLESAYEAFSSGFSRMKDYQRSGGQGANLRELEGEYVYWLGRTLLARGAAGEARKYLNLVLLDYPGHPLEPLALYYLTESHREDGDTRKAEDAWRRFGEAVRNTSLESVSENPNLVAVARARESGDLNRRRDEEPTPLGATADEALEAESEAAREDEPIEDRDARLDEEEEEAAMARGAATAEDLAPPGDEQGLRAPEPGRAGGVVEAEPLGRRVEAPPAEPAEAAAEEAGAGATEADDQERETGRAAPETTDAAEAVAVAPEAADAPAGEAPADDEVPERAETDAADDTGEREAPVLEQGRAVAAGQARRAQDTAEPAGEGRPTEAGAVTAPDLTPIAPGTVFLQSGAFTSAESAGRLSTQLRRKGFDPVLHSGLVNGQGYYRVRFGPYEVPRDRSILESMRNALGDAGFEAVVMRAE